MLHKFTIVQWDGWLNILSVFDGTGLDWLHAPIHLFLQKVTYAALPILPVKKRVHEQREQEGRTEGTEGTRGLNRTEGTEGTEG